MPHGGVAGVQIGIGGVGTGTFTATKALSVNTTTSVLALRDPSIFFDLLDLQHVAFGTYTLQTPIGPLSIGNPAGLQFTGIASTLGSTQSPAPAI